MPGKRPRPDCRDCLFAKVKANKRVVCAKNHWYNELGNWPRTYATVTYFMARERPAPTRCRDFRSLED